MGTIVEYTAPYTPQQNGKVKCAFPTLFGRACAVFNRAKCTNELQKKCEVFWDAVQKMLYYISTAEIGDLHTMHFLVEILPI